MLQIARAGSLFSFRSIRTVTVYQIKARKMSSEVANRLESRAQQAEEAIDWLKKQVGLQLLELNTLISSKLSVLASEVFSFNCVAILYCVLRNDSINMQLINKAKQSIKKSNKWCNNFLM